MANAAYDSDLTVANSGLISDASAEGSWDESSDGNWDDGGPPSDEADYYIQGAACISCLFTKTGAQTMMFIGGATTVDTDGAILVWAFFVSPPSLNTYANGGLMTLVGSGLGDFYLWNASGSNFEPNPFGGWYNYAVNPNDPTGAVEAQLAADTTVGTPTATKSHFGMAVQATAQERGRSFGVDAIRVGRCTIEVTDGVGGTAGTFDGMGSFDTSTNERYGVFQPISGGYLWKGLMSLGLSGSAVIFTDSNVNVFIDNTPKVSAAFNKVEIHHVDSEVTWTSVGISNPGVSNAIAATASRGNFEVVDNATVTLTNCTFSDMGTFIFNDGSNLNLMTGTTFRRCDLITTGGATFTGCTFDDTIATRAVYAATGTEAQKISNSEFISGGTGYGLEVDGAVDDFILSNVTWTGYAAQGGVDADKAIHILAVTDTVTITVSGGTTPSYHSDGATVIISDDVVNSVTIKDSAQNNIENCAVAVYLDSDGSELANEFTSGTGKVTFSCPVSSPFTIRARKNSPGDTRYFPATQTGNSGASGVDLTMSLIEDAIAS